MPPKIREREQETKNNNSNNNNNNNYDWRKDPQNPAAALFRRRGGFNAVVTNKTISKFQDTAEQLIAESYELHARNENNAKTNSAQSDLVLTSREELEAYRSQKRKKFEEILRRDMSRMGNWLSYTAWEEGQGAFENFRGLFERAVSHLGMTKPDIWIHYAKAEIRSGDLSCARSVLERALQSLPSENSLWLHSIMLEKCLKSSSSGLNNNSSEGNNRIRDLFTEWIQHKPGHPAWREFIQFEITILRQIVTSNSTSKNSSSTQEQQQESLFPIHHHQQSSSSSLSSSSSAAITNQLERIRNLLNRYVTAHNEADSWLYYASCEQEITLLSSSSSSIAAKRVIKILETSLQAVPESASDQTDAARLALTMAKAYEVAADASHTDTSHNNNHNTSNTNTKKAKEIYTRLLDQFLDDVEPTNEDDSSSQSSLTTVNDLKQTLRTIVCDSLSALEKKTGSLQAAVAVEERRKRWELEQHIKRNDRQFLIDGDESSALLAKLQLLRLERNSLSSSSKFSTSEQHEQKMMKLASLYESFCFPPFYLATTAFLQGLSICWESFVLFCEHDLMSQNAASDVMKRAVEFVQHFATVSKEEHNNSNNSNTSRQQKHELAMKKFAETKNKTLLLSKLMEFTAMLHLRQFDLNKFRMCMRLSINILGQLSDELYVAPRFEQQLHNNNSSSIDDDNDDEAGCLSGSRNDEVDCFGFSTRLRMGDKDFELHPLFGPILRWIEIEKKIFEQQQNQNQQQHSTKQISEILFFALKFQLCRRNVDFWLFRADAVRMSRNAATITTITTTNLHLQEEISILEEALSEVFGRFVFSFDEDLEESYNSILCRLLRLQLLEKKDVDLAINTLESHIESIEKIVVEYYLSKAKKNSKNSNTETEEENMITAKIMMNNTVVDSKLVEEEKEKLKKRSEMKRRWYDSLLVSAFQMMQQFYFSCHSDNNQQQQEKAISLTRDFYKRAYTRIRRKVGTEISVSAVKSLWSRFEDEFGTDETRKAMVSTSTAATQRTNRLFARAKKI